MLRIPRNESNKIKLVKFAAPGNSSSSIININEEYCSESKDQSTVAVFA